MELLSWIEQLGFSTWVREAGSLWGYPTHPLPAYGRVGFSGGSKHRDRFTGLGVYSPLALITFGKVLPHHVDRILD